MYCEGGDVSEYDERSREVAYVRVICNRRCASHCADPWRCGMLKSFTKRQLMLSKVKSILEVLTAISPSNGGKLVANVSGLELAVAVWVGFGT